MFCEGSEGDIIRLYKENTVETAMFLEENNLAKLLKTDGICPYPCYTEIIIQSGG